MTAENIFDVKENWSKVLERISKKINKPTYEAWVKPTYPVSIENNTLIISTSNEFAKDWLASRYKEHFKDAVKEVNNSSVEIDFIVQEKVEKVEEESTKEIVQNSPSSADRILTVNHPVKGNLNPKYTFDSFVVGNHNRFAHAAAIAVGESPGQAYNPLFIYGGAGLGKTHLMHAIGFKIVAKFKDVRVSYVSTERFTNELINSIKDEKTLEFKNKYRNIDLLLVDDIQFIENKERTQEEFFHTFNALYDEGKQIIISSDRHPKDIPRLEDRLRSRFEMGLLTDIQPPDFETRIAILKKKSEIERITVSDDILHYIASAFKDNVRELEGAFIRVMAYASLTNIPVSVNLARTILGREPFKELTLEIILEAVSNFYSVNPEDLKSNVKTKEIAWARHVAMYVSREMTKYSLQKISMAFGRKDHTTVLHAYEKVKNLVLNGAEISNEIQKIIDTLV